MGLIIIAVLALVVFGILIFPYAFTKTSVDATIRIPSNATYSTLSDTLHKYYDNKFCERVIGLIKSRNVDLSKRCGAYEINKGASPISVMRRLTRGGQTPVRLTVNHFRNLRNLAEGISHKVDFSADDFMKAATDSATLAKYGLTPEQALSLFVENTYEVYWNNTPEEVIKKFGDFYNVLWGPVNKEKAALLNMTPAEVMTVASIVDEETNRHREKGHVGQLYINRLHQGMKLQADPTVKYALGNFSIRRITKEMLQTPSPYNTYQIQGLPPGPIRTTSQKTVEAILNAPETQDLYMCAKEDFSGYHNFATNYDEHVKNALRYQHALDQRGIK